MNCESGSVSSRSSVAMEDGKRRRGRKAPGALEMVNILLKVGVKDRAFLPSPLLAILMMETSYGYLVWPDTRSSRKGRQGMAEGERERELVTLQKYLVDTVVRKPASRKRRSTISHCCRRGSFSQL